MSSRPLHPTSFGADLPGAQYHHEWWQLDGRICAMGIHGQLIAIDHQADMVVVINASPPEPNSTPQRPEQLRLVAALSAALQR